MKIERVEVPVRLEKRLAALLEDLAKYKRMTLTSCLEEILLHTCEPWGDEVTQIGPFYQDLIDVHQRLHEWLAGPSPTPADYIRALAATEVLGAALGWTPMIAETPDDVIRTVLLESATAVLRLPKS